MSDFPTLFFFNSVEVNLFFYESSLNASTTDSDYMEWRGRGVASQQPAPPN